MLAKSDGGANQVQKLTSVSPPTAKVCRLCPCMHVYDFGAIIITSPLLCSSVQDPSSQVGCSTLSSLSSQPADWHLHFSIPERESFSGSVQRAIDMGIVSSKARREIVQVLRTLIAMHTLYPISDHYVTICQKLIAEFPKLRDPIGTNGFVSVLLLPKKYTFHLLIACDIDLCTCIHQGSWRMSLRNSFKNFRRDHPIDENGEQIHRPVSSHNPEPPHKRMKPCADDDQIGMDDEEDVSYEEMVRDLQSEYRKGRKERNHSVLKQLMEKTRNGRRRWIETERPLVHEAIDTFPCLATSKGVSK